MESYLKAVKIFRSYGDPSEDPQYSEVSLLTAAVVIVKIGIFFSCQGGIKRVPV